MKKFKFEFVVRGGTNVEKVWQPCDILFEGEKFIVVRNANGREFSRRKAKLEIREIDTRTAEQKCIDDITSKCFMECEAKAFLSDVKAGKITGLKWVGDEK